MTRYRAWFLDLSYFFFGLKKRPYTQGEGPCSIKGNVPGCESPGLSQRELQPYTWGIISWERGTSQTFGVLDTASEVPLISGGHHGPSVRVGRQGTR